MSLLILILEVYVTITVLAILTSIARFVATSKAERDARKLFIKKVFEKAEQAEKEGKIVRSNSILAKLMNMKIDGIKENKPFKVFIFNAIMHFVPMFNIGILVTNLGDVVNTFMPKKTI